MSDFWVVGGIGGTTARLEDLDRAAAVLSSAAEVVRGVGVRARVLRHALVQTPLLPECGHERMLAIERVSWVDWGPGGATAIAWDIDDAASNLRQTVDLLEDAERQSMSLLEGLRRGWDKTVSLVEIGVWVPLKVVGAGVGFATDALDFTPLGWGGTGQVLDIVGGCADVINPDWTPNLAPLLYGDDLQFLLSIAADKLQPIIGGTAWLAERMGLEAPDGLIELLAADLAAVAIALDYILGNPRGLFVAPVASRRMVPPDGVVDVLGRLTGLSPTGADGPGAIAIERIEHADGNTAWIVEIPGTQDWSPDGSSNPIDVTSDLLLMATGVSDLTLAVQEAMRQAGIPEDEPVMIVGHSQGGIAAMALASDPGFATRFDVEAVVTAGAPAALFDPPDETSVLSIEHTSDTVPALDGKPNPDRRNWVTARRDLGASSDPLDRAADGDIVGRHELAGYLRTAERVDTSGDASIRAWFDEASPFFADEGSTSVRTVFEATRGTDRPIVASDVPAMVATS